MDINQLLSDGMSSCGRVLKLLPKDGEDGIGSPQKYMMKVIRNQTLPSLNILHPFIIKKTFSTADLIPIEINSVMDSLVSSIPDRVTLDDRYSSYRVPLEFTDGHEIMTIKSCVPVTGNFGAYGNGYNPGSYNELAPYSNHWGRSSSGDLYGAVLAATVSYADRQLLGEVKRNFRFYFSPPNILMITNYSGPLNASFCCKNDENLITLDDMSYEGVRRLFILDLKKTIYNEFGNFTEIETPIGSVDLKIGAWESAESERNELYDTYRSTSHFRTSSIRS